jgi:hypothetical protein
MSSVQTHFNKAIQEIEHRNPNRPAVDLSIQRLDNGAVISTRERIVKDVCHPLSVTLMLLSHMSFTRSRNLQWASQPMLSSTLRTILPNPI